MPFRHLSQREEAEVAMRYIGKAWAAGGRGPMAYDCFGLISAIYSDVFGIDILNPSDITETFQSVESPSSMCIVGMRTISASHVGLWMESDRGGILHAIHPNGVVFTRKNDIESLGCRINGYYACNILSH